MVLCEAISSQVRSSQSDGRESFNDLVAEEDFIDEAHVKHVDDAAQVWTTLVPPCAVCINEQIVKDFSAFRRVEFFEFHAIEEARARCAMVTPGEYTEVVVPFPAG